MIDRDLRDQLSQDLRWLITARISNYTFDDAYSDQYIGSQDPAVVRIAEFGYGLFSDTPEYRLNGRHAVDPATRRNAARCILFLRSDHDYDWPPWPLTTCMPRLLSLLADVGATIGTALTICFLLITANPGVEEIGFGWPIILFWPLGLMGFASCVYSVWYFCGGRRIVIKHSRHWQAWLRHGDHEVWPFRWREDFYEARRRPHLLAGPQHRSLS